MDNPTYALSTWLFLRLLGAVYLIAFVSLGTQVRGLAGSRGIFPVGSNFPAAAAYHRLKAYFQRPTVFLWNTSDAFLTRACVIGAVLAVLLIAGVAPIPVLFLLWLLYLSLLHICGLFLGYQWDVLLLEVGFLSIFLAPLEILPHFPPAQTPSSLAHWLAIWLLFRLTFASGVVKLRSGDKTWRDLTAMAYHYETQPIPNRLAWHAHRLPMRVQKGSTAATLLIELLIPFGFFAPPPVNYGCAAVTVALMLLIFATGNYTFFNLLTIALCLLVFDDAFIVKFFDMTPPNLATPPLAWQIMTGIVAVMILLLSVNVIARLFRREFPWPGFITKALDRLRPFVLVGNYGLFANMTTRRPEIVIEGSRDGMEWKSYAFRWKPGDLKRPPRQVAPHQPRLDWQMWFAALAPYHANPWFIAFLKRLLENSPDVVKLLKANPFPDEPPQFIRALLYDYHFTTRQERRETGAWWRREYLGPYCPTITSRLQAYPYYTPPPAGGAART